MLQTYISCVILIHTAASLVPKPTTQKLGTRLFSLTGRITLEHQLPRCFILQEAFRSFLQELRLRPSPTNRSDNVAGNVDTIRIRTESQCDETKVLQWPSVKMQEQYEVAVGQDHISIEAKEVWGVLHALQTVLQLIHRTAAGLIVIEEQTIKDGPRFIHRGFLIDTSRHYLPLGIIFKFLDAMSMVKMNVLHWHIVDTESFPYVSYTYPELADKGAFDPVAYVYTTSDVKKVIEHARQNGIRVMAEFDTPGHSESLAKSHPEVMTECFHKGKPTGSYGPINPAKKETYDFLFELFTEVVHVFPDDMIHLGGDEVEFSCWASNPEVRDFMEQMGFKQNYSRLQSYYIEQLIDLLSLTKPKGQANIPVVWQEVFDHGFRGDNRTVVHIWKEQNWRDEMKNVTEAGYQVLLSSCWYLNMISYGVDWQKYYACDPTDFEGTPKQLDRVLGGEAAMWGEHVDKTNVFSQSWPRGAAVAERLWSEKDLDPTEFGPRLDELRCQMLRRGWDAEPVNGPGFCPV